MMVRLRRPDYGPITTARLVGTNVSKKPVQYEIRRVNPWVGIKTRSDRMMSINKVTQHEHDMK